MTYPPIMFFEDKSLSSDGCVKPKLSMLTLGRGFNPEVNFEIAQPEACEVPLDDFRFNKSGVELLLRIVIIHSFGQHSFFCSKNLLY